MSRLGAAVLGLILFAAGVGVGLLLAEDDSPQRRVDASDVERSIWEGVPGAGAPPDCRASEPSGIGEWRCTIDYHGPRRPPRTIRVAVDTGGSITRGGDGRELACCIPVAAP